MDRLTTRMDADARTMSIELPNVDAFLPPSRQFLVDHCRASLEVGPVLLTGDAGIGKTWVLNRLIRQSSLVRLISVDLTPNDGPSDFYRHLARGLGLAATGHRGPDRLDIAELLTDRSADGERFALAIDEAQNISSAVWEEVRVLLNRFGAVDGFAQIILIGQTELVRQFATRSLRAIESRLTAHIHLRPIEISEAREWLRRFKPDLNLLEAELESLHRDAGGNPSRLIRQAAAYMTRKSCEVAVAPLVEAKTLVVVPSETDLDNSLPTAMSAVHPLMVPPLTGSDRPPLFVEENSIEVGWSAEESESSAYDQISDSDETDRSLPIASGAESSEQAVHDHYAALQAWREWTSNQEKQVGPVKSDRDLADEIDEAAAVEAADHAENDARERNSIRSEGHQHFAPFGQLFNRMAPVRES